MSIKNILVAYNGTESSDAALKSALQLRKKYDAHLTGLLAYGVQSANVAVNAWMPKNIESLLDEARHEASKRVRDQFEKITGSVKASEKIHWISAIDQTDATVAKYARMCDLTILGRYEAVQGEARTVLNPDTIAMISGRPVLIVPRNTDMAEFCDNAVIAWDGQRASARALGDAMQLLSKECLVTLATVSDGSSDKQLPGMDIETNLKRHDFNVQVEKLKIKKHSIGKTLLLYLQDINATLLVMGAYEHSKFRETVVGGVTNRVLKEAKLPILISH